MPDDFKLTDAAGREWEAYPWGPSVSCEVGHAASYYGCSHEIELSRDDLLGLLALLDRSVEARRVD